MKKLKSLLSSLLATCLCATMFAGIAVPNTVNAKTSSHSPKIEKYVNKSENAMNIARSMGNGIDLGNTMEAYGRNSLGTSADVSAYETLWGMPVTTKESIQGMKAAGFDCLRVPVAWTNMMNYESGDYTINPALLDRVGQIVTWAMDADMYVIIDDHWDGGWWGMFGQSDPTIRAKAMDMYTSMWTQIGTYFKNYSHKLIFESGNEELGSRLNDAINGVSGTLTEDECYETTNKINQTFVDTIRSTRFHNKSRFLLLAGYNTNIDATVDSRYKLPTDSARDRLMVSVHYYDPWSYCGGSSQASWKSEAAYKYMNDTFAKLKKFTDAGVPVIVGEYGALKTSDGQFKNNTVEFTKNILDNCDLNGCVPLLWDCNDFYKRSSHKIEYQELADLYKSRSYSLSEYTLTEEQVKENATVSLEEGLAVGRANDENSGSTPLDGENNAVAWIMYADSNWSSYNTGNTYTPSQTVDGLVASDVQINGPGTYTVGLDLTGTATGYFQGLTFSAIGISNGEKLYPNYVITIKDVKINGSEYNLNGNSFTTSDDNICTRANLYNGWIGSLPDNARTATGSLDGCSATLINPSDINQLRTMQVTFTYEPAQTK